MFSKNKKTLFAVVKKKRWGPPQKDDWSSKVLCAYSSREAASEAMHDRAIKAASKQGRYEEIKRGADHYYHKYDEFGFIYLVIKVPDVTVLEDKAKIFDSASTEAKKEAFLGVGADKAFLHVLGEDLANDVKRYFETQTHKHFEESSLYVPAKGLNNVSDPLGALSEFVRITDLNATLSFAKAAKLLEISQNLVSEQTEALRTRISRALANSASTMRIDDFKGTQSGAITPLHHIQNKLLMSLPVGVLEKIYLKDPADLDRAFEQLKVHSVPFLYGAVATSEGTAKMLIKTDIVKKRGEEVEEICPKQIQFKKRTLLEKMALRS